MPDVFKSITRLVYHSNGGFGFQELYSGVPVYIRRFLVDEIESIKKREKEAMEGEDGGGNGPPDDMAQKMEQLQKSEAGDTEKVQEDLQKVFGDEVTEDRKDPTKAEDRAQTPPSQRTPLHEQKKENSEESPEPDEPQPDPADADDLEQMINKLQGDM